MKEVLPFHRKALYHGVCVGAIASLGLFTSQKSDGHAVTGIRQICGCQALLTHHSRIHSMRSPEKGDATAELVLFSPKELACHLAS